MHSSALKSFSANWNIWITFGLILKLFFLEDGLYFPLCMSSDSFLIDFWILSICCRNSGSGYVLFNTIFLLTWLTWLDLNSSLNPLHQKGADVSTYFLQFPAAAFLLHLLWSLPLCVLQQSDRNLGGFCTQILWTYPISSYFPPPGFPL